MRDPCCAFCAASEAHRPELGPVRWRDGWLPHVVMHDKCAAETQRGGLD